MKKEFLKKIPQWYKDTTEYDVVLSNDIDGLVSASALKYAKDWDVNYFYDFGKLFINKDICSKEKKSVTRVWADVSIIKQEKSFDNHVNRFSPSDYTNLNSINPNIISNVTNMNYYYKYVGSSALIIWSLYGIPLPKTELGKMLLLTIDVTFKGFYGNGLFKQRHKFYLCDMLGFEELYEVEKRHNKHEFYQLIDKYNLAKPIWIDENGCLKCNFDLDELSDLLGIPLSLPDKTFTVYHTMEKRQGNLSGMKSVKEIKNLISLAFVGRNQGCYSILTE